MAITVPRVHTPIQRDAHVPLLHDHPKLLQGSIDVGVTGSLCVAYSKPVWLLYRLTRSIQGSGFKISVSETSETECLKNYPRNVDP
jgi:hypothetical protein